MNRIFSVVGYIVAWSIIALTLVVSPILGSASSVVAQLFGLLLLPVAWRNGAIAEISKAPAQLIFVGVVVVLTLLYAITARQPGNILYFANFLALPISALVYVVALSQQGRRTAIVLARLCVLGTVVSLGCALIEVYGMDRYRAMGIVGNPNLMPRLALPLGFVAMVGFFVDSGTRRWLYLLGPLAATLTTIFCGSRGAAVAIPAMALIAAIFLFRDRHGRWVVIGGVALAAAALLGGLAIVGPSMFGRFGTTITAVIAALQDTGAADGASSVRVEMYTAGITAFLQSPWIGWGWANLGNAAAEVNPARFADEAGTQFMFHNDLVNFAVAGGVVGLGCLVAILVAPVIGALASPRDEFFAARLYCCLILSVGFAIFGLTDSTLGYDAPTTLYAYLTAMVLGVCRPTPAAGGPAARP